DSLQGAVRVVDLRARALEITTGVGMALRVVRLRIAAETRLTAAGAALPLAQLQRGDIVRASFGTRPGGFVAYTIERVGRMTTTKGGGGGGTPGPDSVFAPWGFPHPGPHAGTPHTRALPEG